MKKNSRRTAARRSPAAAAAEILRSAAPRPRGIGWYHRITAEQREVVDAVASLCKTAEHANWYPISRQLIETLGLSVNPQRVVLKLQQLAGVR